MLKHAIQPGDCISSLGFQYGFWAETIRKHPENSELRRLRGSMIQLVPGDVVSIPELKPGNWGCADGKRHQFRRKGVPVYLRLQLLDNGEPRAGVPCRLEVEGRISRGQSDNLGIIELAVSPGARSGVLVVGRSGEEQTYELSLGDLAPPRTIAGAQARLNNLGFPCGAPTGEMNEATRQAIRDFQSQQGKAEPTGELDAKTQDDLARAHDGGR